MKKDVDKEVSWSVIWEQKVTKRSPYEFAKIIKFADDSCKK